MTQEEKELLLKDICARLPYGVKVKFYLPLNTHFVIETLRDVEIRNENILVCTTTWNAIKLEICKPYLRSLSSMTEEEENEYQDIVQNDGNWVNLLSQNLMNFFNKHHFDYHGLIEKGLALEAPEDMYKDEKKV